MLDSIFYKLIIIKIWNDNTNHQEFTIVYSEMRKDRQANISIHKSIHVASMAKHKKTTKHKKSLWEQAQEFQHV